MILSKNSNANLTEHSTDASVSEKKQALRGIVRLRLQTLEPDPRRSTKVQARLSSLLVNLPGRWLGYSALPSEVALPEINEIQWAYPKIVGDQLQFFAPTSVNPTWLVNSFAVREPSGDSTWEPVNLDTVRGVVVPGLGFDRSRHRLGRGGGYYDRYLNQKKVSESEIVKVGVGFACQLVGEIPVEPHDVRLDAVVTESESILDLRRFYEAI